MWQVGSRGHVRSKGGSKCHVRCMVGIAVWGRMYGNRKFGGEPGSLLLYIIRMTQPKDDVSRKFPAVTCPSGNCTISSTLFTNKVRDNH